jgi:hypothetical protein
MKKSRKGFLVIALLFSCMIASCPLKSQAIYSPGTATDFQYTIENDFQNSPYDLLFDLYLKDTDPAEPFPLSMVQAGVLVSTSIVGTGTITCSIIPGYSDLIPEQQPTSIAYQVYSTDQFLIKLAPRIPPGCSNASTISTQNPGTRIARLKIINSVPFVTNSQASLHFCMTPYPYPNYGAKVFEYTILSPCTSTELDVSENNCFNGSTYQNIHLNSGTSIIPAIEPGQITITSIGNTIRIIASTDITGAMVTVTNLLGQQIQVKKMSDPKENEVQVNENPGIYLVRVQGPHLLKTGKVWIESHE